MLLAERQADQGLSSRLRLQDRRQIDCAKTRNEEWSPLKLLADGLGLGDADTFRWRPAGAADFVITSGEKIVTIQCTMAYDEPSDAARRDHQANLPPRQRQIGKAPLISL